MCAGAGRRRGDSLFHLLSLPRAVRRGTLEARSFQIFRAWSSLVPGEASGWLRFALAACAFGFGRSGSARRIAGDPRAALAVGALAIALLATGGNVVDRFHAASAEEPEPFALPNLYAWLAAVTPGLDAVRVPASIYRTSVVAFSILAGLGGAALLRRTPQHLRAVAGLGLIALASMSILRPTFLGFEPLVRLEMVDLTPDPAEVSFFRELSRRGSSGAILELPVTSLDRAAKSVLLSAYHRRPTSACYNSFMAPVFVEVRSLAEQLPDRAAFGRLHEMGFTTVVLHHPPTSPVMQAVVRRFERYRSSGRAPALVRLERSATLSAYELVSKPRPDLTLTPAAERAD